MQELAGFKLTAKQILELANRFQKAMADGLAGRSSSLKMLPSFLTKPTGQEKGLYLAVDFGGTNVRVLTLELQGNGVYRTLQRRSFPLRDQAKGYDFTSRETTGSELFGFIAGQIAAVLAPGQTYPLGFTFSFPSRQTGINQAVLIKWTKEFLTSGVAGQDVAKLLQMALEEKNITSVKPIAVINDTVGTLLTAAYGDRQADIGSICGTGHNTCYLEPSFPGTGQPMIINMESGNFNELPDTEYDRKLDSASHTPGEQRLEKMVSGQYIGELARLIMQDLINKEMLFAPERPEIFFNPYQIKAEHLTRLLADESPELNDVEQWLATTCQISGSRLEARIILRAVAEGVVTRAAQLIAATYTGIIKHLDPNLEQRHTIAIDGSLYEFMPLYADKLNSTLNSIFEDKPDFISTKLTKDGSGVGAAIAAAIVKG